MFSYNNTTRQALVIVAMILIPCLALAYFIFYENIRTRMEHEMEKNIELAKVTAQYLDTYVQGIKLTLGSFNSRGMNHTGTTDLKINTNQYLNTLRNFKDSQEAEKYFILNPKGVELAAYPQNTETTKIPDEYLQRAAKQGSIVELLNPTKDPVKVVIISTILDDSKYIKGFAGAIISMEKVAQDFANIKVSNNGYLIMIDKTGRILVHPDTARFRQRIPPEKIQDDPIYLASSKGMPGAIEIVAPFDGKKKLFSFAPVRETGWIVLLVEPEIDLHVVVTKNLTRNSVVFLLVIISVFSLYQYLKLSLQKAAQEEAFQAEKLALVAQLAAGMAHEIRNPLTSIKGFLQILMAGETSQKKKEHQTIMLTEIERIEHIITEILLLAKPQKQKIVRFSLNTLVKETVPEFAQEAANRNINIILNLTREALNVSGDPTHTKQAVINIIKNAIEASPDWETVTIDAFCRDSKAVVQITDRGRGISEDIIDKVGTPFFTTKADGIGLGVIVTKRIVESMGGNFYISSKPGQGTKVVISLNLT